MNTRRFPAALYLFATFIPLDSFILSPKRNRHDFTLQSTSFQSQATSFLQETLQQSGCTDAAIDFQSSRIIITVNGVLQDDETFDEDNDDALPVPSDAPNIVDLSRAVQASLDMDDTDSIGYQIGLRYEIEVTTPGASDELQGIMFESYKGFDVLVDCDIKDKSTIIEGRLVERNKDQTIINIKGRMKKIPNENIRSVKLPKAKREKGAR